MPPEIPAEKPVDGLEVIDHGIIMRVGRLAVGSGTVEVSAHWTVSQLGALHADARTEGLFRIEGTACVADREESWSAILKIINAAADAGVAARWVSVEHELKVYREHLLEADGVPFRPARCYGVDDRQDGRTWVWLEDMTKAPQPPWSAQQYKDTSYRLGRFNGHYATQVPALVSALPRRIFRRRYDAGIRGGFFPDLRANRNNPVVLKAHTAASLDATIRLSDISERLMDAAARMPLSIAHGDCHARNLFPLDETVVAVDWSGLAMEPTGADLGVLVGSGLTWGLEEMNIVAEIEPVLFSKYVEGLRDSGWDGDTKYVRLGFFAQFSLYLLPTLTWVNFVVTGFPENLRRFYEARFGSPVEQWPERFVRIIPSLAHYTDEVESLLNNFGTLPKAVD